MRDSIYSCNLYPNKYSQEFHYSQFEVKLDRCVGSVNTINDLSNKVCIPKKNKITGINESKTLTEHFSCECKCTCKFDGTKYK